MDKDTIGLKSIIVKYLHHWKFFIAVFIFSFIPAILYLIYYPKTYEIVASIQLQEDKESSMSGLGLMGGDASGLMKSFGIGVGGGSLSIDDEMSVIKSNRMLRLMILDLGLNVTYTKPYSFYKLYDDSPLILTADSVTMENLDDEYRFMVSVSPGSINVKAKSKLGGHNETFSYNSLPAKIKIGRDEFVLDFNNGADIEKSFKLEIRCIPASWQAEILSKKIDIEDVSSSSNVLEIAHSDHSKDRGKDVVNMLIEKYNDDTKSYKRSEDTKTMAFVDSRIANTVADLKAVELEIEKYKKNNDITFLESDALMFSDAMKELFAAIIVAESQIHIINMLDEFVKDPANKYSVVPSILTASDGENGGSISQYNEAIVDYNRLLSNSSATNTMVQIKDIQVTKLREGVHVMIGNTQKSNVKVLEELKARENELKSKMSTLPEKEREYMSYRLDQEIYQGIYLMLLQKKEETVLSLGVQTDRARIIEPPYIKKKPIGPRKLYAAIGMLIFTLVIPIGYLFAKDLFLSIKEEYSKND